MEIAEIEVSYSTNSNNISKVSCSKDSFEVFIKSWNNKTIELQEEFKILLLNRNNQVLGIYTLSKGGTTQTIVDIKLLFSVVLKCNAQSIILAHNHPSGNIMPSQADKKITNKIAKASKLLEISLLDHLIISKNKYYSFADEQLI